VVAENLASGTGNSGKEIVSMKHKVAELTGDLLDQAVARANGWVLTGDCWMTPENTPADGLVKSREGVEAWDHDWCPTVNWEQAGPIIERERISVLFDTAFADVDNQWCGALKFESAECGTHYSEYEQTGNTPLIAAMRTYVASKFGK
jgi:hypothetical protein